jgi:biopolymer transport protein ExbD
MADLSLKNTLLTSPLLQTMTLRPKQKRGKKNMLALLILTSLVDAFSIMLLYLLFNNTGATQTLNISKDMHLPIAVKTDVLSGGTVVRVENGHYFLNDQETTQAELPSQLQQLQATSPAAKDGSLIVQADEAADFDKLAPILRSGALGGFHSFKFAVVQAEGK